MSKLRDKKYKMKASNPTGIPSIQETEICLENFVISDVENITDKLKSSSAEEREVGAMILANMADNPKFVSDLIERKIIRVAGPLLLDKSMSVRHAIAGSLRNIAVCGDYLVSEAMVEQDIMTCLVTLLEQYKDPWISVKSVEDRIDSKSEIFLEACNLLWTLCENSNTAVSIFNERNLTHVLLPCLSLDNYNLKIPIAVAQCLQTASENNSVVIDILQQPLVQEQLRALMTLTATEPGHMLLRTLSAGITANIYRNKIEHCMSDVTRPIMQAVSSALCEPISTILEELSNKIICQKAGRLDKYHEEADLEVERKAVHKAEESLMYVLSAKQTSLEILGNIFEGGSDDDYEDISCSETSEEIEMEVEEYNISTNEFGHRISEDIHEIVVNDRILEKVHEQIFMQSEEAERNIENEQSTKDCMKKLHTVRRIALLCLNNMLPKLDVEDIGGPSKLLELWVNIANVLFKKTDFSNTDQVEALTRCMYSVLQKLALAGFATHFSSMTEQDLKLLLNVYSQSKDAQTKVHIIGCLGTIGKILCQLKAPTSAHIIKMIGAFLLESCNKNVELWVLAEIIDATIDVFSDDDVDFVAKEIDLVENLTRLRILFEKKLKQQRKSLGDRADVIRTARDNLKNFIKYKLDFDKK